MPTVLLDLRMVEGPLHGIARYALELARRLPGLAPGWRFQALVGPGGLPADLGALQPSMEQVRCRAGYLSPLEQPVLAATLAAARPDLFHATSFSLPALWPGRLVATLHDANHLALAANYGLAQQIYYRAIVRPRAGLARALVTVSEFSRQELARHLGLSPYRFQVISPGVDAVFRPPAPSEVATLRQRLGLPARYFVAVGNTKAHKNLRLLSGIEDGLGAPLVLVAGEGAASQLGFRPSTRELFRLSDADLATLYGGAVALLLPSRYEGFGLPAIEAMATGCPVVAARAGSLPEVVGQAGVLLSPDEATTWKEEALRLLRDERRARELGEKGRARALHFSWDSCARQTLAVYERALG